MPTYTYKALTHAGEKTQGTLLAATRRDAIARLVAGGKNVLDLYEDAGSLLRARRAVGSFSLLRKRIRLSPFARQLATLSEAGVPLVQSLNVLIEQTKEPHTVRILTEIRESVEGGATLADALAQHPRVFPKIMSSMVRVGEMGGTLDEVLLQLADLFEKEETIKGKVRAALAYPLLVLFLGLASAVFLMVFLIPRLKTLFEDVGHALPLPTRILLGMSELMSRYGFYLAILLVLAIVAYRVAMRSHQSRLVRDRYKLRIPAFGKLIRSVAIARFARLLGTLTRGGIAIVDGMDIVHPALNNQVISDAVHTMCKQIRSGESVTSVMKKAKVFPPLPIQMIAVGEETGRLDQMLLRVADTYEREAATATSVMTSLLAPLLILFVAGIVGFIILAMLLPIFQLSSVIG